MIAQSNRSPKRRKNSTGYINAIKKLISYRHLDVARIAVGMCAKSSKTVNCKDKKRSEVPDNGKFDWKAAIIN